VYRLYNLLGQRRPKDALAVFQLNAWAHPQSANAQDSLADGYLSVHDKENARAAVQREFPLRQLTKHSTRPRNRYSWPRKKPSFRAWSSAF